MKTKLLLLALSLAVSAFAADTSGILLMGKTFSQQSNRVSGDARAVIGDFKVMADTITFEETTNTLQCDGAVTIKTNGQTITASHCKIDLGAEKKSVYILNPDGVAVKPTAAAPAQPSATTPAAQR